MTQISQQSLVSVYLRHDSQVDGAEMASLIRNAGTTAPQTAVSARLAEFANPLDRQVVRIVRGEIPGAERLFTPTDLTHIRRRVELANDPNHARQMSSTVAQATSAIERSGNNVELHIDGADVYANIRRLVNSAQRTIDIEFFTFHDDSSGFAMARELAQAAQRGVRVNVMLDHMSAGHSPQVIQIMRDAGVNVRTFANGFQTPDHHPNSTTDHRKMVLVDGREGMTGGMNIGERYEQYWHDVMVSVQGPVLNDLYREYATNWTASGGAFPRDAVDLARQNARPVGTMGAAVHITTPTEHQIQDGLFAAIDRAQDHVYIQSPYFIDGPLVERLTQAAQRGVRVVATIPSVGDNAVIDYMNLMRINQMVSAGVQVRNFDTQNHSIEGHDHVMDYFAHAKLATVDGVWTTIGTANADARAMRVNQEINLAVTSPQFAQTIERRYFHHDAVNGRVTPGSATRFSHLTVLIRGALQGVSPLL